MKYIITETQTDYLKRWKNFVTFMKRRDTEIMELIDNNILNLSVYDEDAFNVGTVIAWTGDDINFIGKIDPESQMRDWVYMYLEDNYGDIIKEKIEGYK
jgi:hypothetical protein